MKERKNFEEELGFGVVFCGVTAIALTALWSHGKIPDLTTALAIELGTIAIIASTLVGAWRHAANHNWEVGDERVKFLLNRFVTQDAVRAHLASVALEIDALVQRQAPLRHVDTNPGELDSMNRHIDLVRSEFLKEQELFKSWGYKVLPKIRDYLKPEEVEEGEGQAAA